MGNDTTLDFVMLKKWIALLGIGIGLAIPCASQHVGFKPIADLALFRDQFKKESSKVSSIESSFVQEKILTALTEKIVSNGKFWFKRSNRVRIEYIKPFSYTMIMNGDKMLLRDGQKENRVNVKSNKLFQQINNIMIDCVQGTILESKDFTVAAFENDRTYLLELVPTSKVLRDFFHSVILRVDKKDFTAESIEMNEKSGDKTTISFKDKKLNTQFSDAVFAF
jgi:outer membrane lipoprotein-sorting protein